MREHDASLGISKICLLIFSGLLVGLCVGAPWLWAKLVANGPAFWWYLAVTYATAAPAALTLYRLFRLVANLEDGRVFVNENVRHLAWVSGCCFCAAAVYLVSALMGQLAAMWVLAPAAGFVGLMVHVVKNVFSQAVALKEENDYTI